MWWKGDSETRYKYLYSSEEIEELTNKIRTTAGQTKLLFAMFNNHWQGYAPRNAVDMMKVLQLPFKDLDINFTSEEDKSHREDSKMLFNDKQYRG